MTEDQLANFQAATADMSADEVLAWSARQLPGQVALQALHMLLQEKQYIQDFQI